MFGICNETQYHKNFLCKYLEHNCYYFEGTTNLIEQVFTRCKLTALQISLSAITLHDLLLWLISNIWYWPQLKGQKQYCTVWRNMQVLYWCYTRFEDPFGHLKKWTFCLENRCYYNCSKYADTLLTVMHSININQINFFLFNL